MGLITHTKCGNQISMVKHTLPRDFGAVNTEKELGLNDYGHGNMTPPSTGLLIHNKSDG